MSTAITCINKWLQSRILAYLVWPWYLIENYNPVRKNSVHWGSRLRNMTSHIPFCSVDQCKLMVWWLRRVVVSRATWFRFPAGCWNSLPGLCLPLAILRGTEPVRALTRALLIRTLYIFCLKFGADRGFTLNIWFPLFWRFGNGFKRARGPDSATCAGPGLVHRQWL